MPDPQDVVQELPAEAGGTPKATGSLEGVTLTRETQQSPARRGIIQDHERFKNILDGIQSLVLCVAIVTGGGWTLYTFISTQQTTRALLERDKMRKEAEEAELQTGVTVEIIAKQIKSVTPDQFGLLVTVTIRNKGDILLPIDLGDPKDPTRIEPLRISHIAQEGGKLYGDRQYSAFPYNNYVSKDDPSGNGFMGSISLLPKIDHALEYYVEVNKTGLYNISFYFLADQKISRKASDQEVKAMGNEFASTTPGHWFGTHTYLEVKNLH
jgi:hypothetical protein